VTGDDEAAGPEAKGLGEGAEGYEVEAEGRFVEDEELDAGGAGEEGDEGGASAFAGAEGAEGAFGEREWEAVSDEEAS
jgi:hypothetical protein